VVNDFGCLVDSGQVELGYDHQNSAPQANDDEIQLDVDSVITISQKQLLENDSDPDGDSLTIVDFGRTGHGRLAFDSSRNLIYRPAEAYTGTDTFSYTVSDGQGATASATVSLQVKALDTFDLSKMQYVNFIYKKTELTPNSQKNVKDIIAQILKAKEIMIIITAHTDNIGSNRYNLDLSERRAQTLKQLLISEGIDADVIVAIGKGENVPMADNSTKEGQAINRRGEFTFRALGLQQ